MTCCFIGHRKIKVTKELRERVRKIILNLIKSGTVNFIFGDHSAFDSLCYDLHENMFVKGEPFLWN